MTKCAYCGTKDLTESIIVFSGTVVIRRTHVPLSGMTWCDLEHFVKWLGAVTGMAASDDVQDALDVLSAADVQPEADVSSKPGEAEKGSRQLQYIVVSGHSLDSLIIQVNRLLDGYDCKGGFFLANGVYYQAMCAKTGQ